MGAAWGAVSPQAHSSPGRALEVRLREQVSQGALAGSQHGKQRNQSRRMSGWFADTWETCQGLPGVHRDRGFGFAHARFEEILGT